MKKFLALYAAMLALFVICAACAPVSPTSATEAPATDAPTPSPTAEPVVANTAAVEETPAATNADSPAPDDTNNAIAAVSEQDIEAMLPVMDSIMRAMGTDVTSVYAPRDEEFFWTVLYLMAVNWGDAHPLIEVEGDTMIVRRMVMQEFASAAFLDYDDLLPVPQILEQSVQYDEGLDAYRLPLSDAGDTAARIQSAAAADNGAYAVAVGMYDAADDALLSTIDFMLFPNPYADAISEPLFRFTVGSATAK